MTIGDVPLKMPCGQCPCCRAVQNYKQNIDLSRDVYGFIPQTGWICPNCGKSNNPTMAQCFLCPGSLNTKITGDTSE